MHYLRYIAASPECSLQSPLHTCAATCGISIYPCMPACAPHHAANCPATLLPRSGPCLAGNDVGILRTSAYPRPTSKRPTQANELSNPTFSSTCTYHPPQEAQTHQHQTAKILRPVSRPSPDPPPSRLVSFCLLSPPTTAAELGPATNLHA